MSDADSFLAALVALAATAAFAVWSFHTGNLWFVVPASLCFGAHLVCLEKAMRMP